MVNHSISARKWYGEDLSWILLSCCYRTEICLTYQTKEFMQRWDLHRDGEFFHLCSGMDHREAFLRGHCIAMVNLSIFAQYRVFKLNFELLLQTFGVNPSTSSCLVMNHVEMNLNYRGSVRSTLREEIEEIYFHFFSRGHYSVPTKFKSRVESFQGEEG